MFGQVLRHDKASRTPAQLLPRELDRYPKTIRADFRACEPSTLKRCAEHLAVELRPGWTATEAASGVARAYRDAEVPSEGEVICNFVSFVHSYQDGLANKRQRVEKEARRRGGRGVNIDFHAVQNPHDSEDDDELDYRSSIGPGAGLSGGASPTANAYGEPDLYCYCNKPSYGKMIGCDNDDCKFQWFHMDCIEVPADPDAAWYCPDCVEAGAAAVAAR